METIRLTLLYHKKQQHIGLHFSRNMLLENIVKKLPGIRWSQTNKCWYLPFTTENYTKVFSAVEGKADVDDQVKQLPGKKSKLAIVQKPPAEMPGEMGPVNAAALAATEEQLILKGYSVSTMRTYLNELRQFLVLLNGRPAAGLTPEDLKRYLLYCHSMLRLSENSLHSRINALKFYYEQVLKREKFFWEIPRPKKKKQLPAFFSQDEIAAIIRSISNKKHKAMLMLAYSAGLRVSEVVHIKTFHVDSSRMSILIQAGKGKKDRMVSLSPVLLVMLREYARLYNPDKKGWLFEGAVKGTPYSSRSLQEVLQQAKYKAGVVRPGSIHSLRHSFATHLVEKGTDVTMIQKLLGHSDLKTTMIYLHTSNKDLLKIISPLDSLQLE